MLTELSKSVLSSNQQLPIEQLERFECTTIDKVLALSNTLKKKISPAIEQLVDQVKTWKIVFADPRIKQAFCQNPLPENLVFKIDWNYQMEVWLYVDWEVIMDIDDIKKEWFCENLIEYIVVQQILDMVRIVWVYDIKKKEWKLKNLWAIESKIRAKCKKTIDVLIVIKQVHTGNLDQITGIHALEWILRH